MEGQELRDRIQCLDITYREAAVLLGLSLPGLNHQMRGEHPVTAQTELLLIHLERAARRGRLDELPWVASRRG